MTVTAAGGATDSAAVRVNLTNVDEPGNEPPVAQDAAFTLPENSPAGTAIGTVVATDSDAGDTLTYALSSGNADPNGNGTAAFAIDPVSGALTINDPGDLDYETTHAFTLGVTVTDASGLADIAAVGVTLRDGNERAERRRRRRDRLSDRRGYRLRDGQRAR